MKLKRGWWKEKGGEHAYVDVQGKSGDWYGIDSDGDVTAWDENGMSVNGDTYDLTDVYCGDGPEPVEPLQLCLGWWECRDGSTAKIDRDNGLVPYRWLGIHNNQWRSWMDNGSHCNASNSPLDIVKRRPDLDAKEAADQQAKTDPRDAEIERLKAENEKLLNAINIESSEINRLLTKCQRLDVKLATIKSEYNNLKRIIGDH